MLCNMAVALRDYVSVVALQNTACPFAEEEDPPPPPLLPVQTPPIPLPACYSKGRWARHWQLMAHDLCECHELCRSHEQRCV